MDDNGWEESRETVVRGLQLRLEKELHELDCAVGNRPEVQGGKRGAH
jgi:hypothetical protein